MSAGNKETALTVLLVEDSKPAAELLARGLSSAAARRPHGAIHVLHAGTLAATRDVLRERSVDVIILDLTLPDAGGLVALKELRARAPDVPVIVLTGVDDEAMAVESLRLGAQDYVLKPAPDGATMLRILSYARERQYLTHQLDAALEQADLAARRWQLLAEIGNVLGAAGIPGAALVDVARCIVPDTAEAFVFFLLDDEEVSCLVEVAATTSQDPQLRGRICALLVEQDQAELRKLFATIGQYPGVQVDEQSGVLRMLVDELGLHAGTAAALRINGEARGFILIADGRDRKVASGTQFVGAVADRIALALEGSHALRQTQRAIAARDRTFGIVSHDLRNPLSTIRICANALLDAEPPSAGGVRNMAQIIERSAVWALQIAQDLLDRASLDAGKLVLKREEIAPGDIVGAAQILFARAAEEQSIDFSVDIGVGLPLIQVDRHRVLQVITNLLSNALAFTPAGGRVTLTVSMSDAPSDGVLFRIADTGSGVDPQEIPHIFDWYWQSGRKRRGGAGLGLAIASGVVQAHGSRLFVASTVGVGTTFWFSLPGVSGKK